MNIIQKIKLLLAGKKAYENIMEASKMKDGIKTTEFWLVVISNLLTLVGALKGVISPETATIIIAVLTAMYNVMRSLVKQPDITTLVDKSTTIVKPNTKPDTTEDGCIKIM